MTGFFIVDVLNMRRMAINLRNWWGYSALDEKLIALALLSYFLYVAIGLIFGWTVGGRSADVPNQP